MNIIIHTGFLPGSQQKDRELFYKEVSGRLALAHPQHSFIFITGEQQNAAISKPGNVTVHYPGKMAVNPLLWKYWYNVKLPGLLKKYKADVFVDIGGVCSSSAKIPQCVLYHEGLYSDKKNFLFLKSSIPRFLNKAKAVIVLSAATGRNAEGRYKVKTDKLSVVYPAGRDMFHTLSEQQQSDIRNKYTEDQNYFISGPLHSMDSFINLLKAFSIFKKRQKSSWRLVIAEASIDYAEKLRSYKYREDVTVVNKVREEELAELVASSYAMVCLQPEESFIMVPAEAMQCGIPAIVPAGEIMKELYDDAVLYTDRDNTNDIAEKMMQLYKDETLRKELIRKGKEKAANFNWDKTTEAFWQTILKAVQ